MTDEDQALPASRRKLLTEALGIAASAIGFGFVYGLSARDAGFSPIEAMAMSTIVFAGAAQFAAVGYVASGLAWPGVILLTALLNARHLLYSAALAPWLRDVPFVRRAVMAHLLTDEAFALTIGHFRRLGRTDEWGYWVGAIVATLIPWNLATLAGVLLGGQIPDPARFGVDIIFPAAMIGLAVGLVTG
ncbi:MAG: AzlC family ABC transporter permease, partial [Candidatus Limnocylindrales bacterium]